MKNEYSNVKNDYQTAKNDYSKKNQIGTLHFIFTGVSMHEKKSA